MVVIRWFLLSLLIVLSTYAQFGWFDKHKQNFYIYTPSTDTAINITSSTAVVNGSNSRSESQG